MQVSGVVLGRLLQCGEGFAPGQDALAFDEPGGLIYLGTGNWERRTATAGSKAAWDALADLRDRYRHACLRAFLARDAPHGWDVAQATGQDATIVLSSSGPA